MTRTLILRKREVKKNLIMCVTSGEGIVSTKTNMFVMVWQCATKKPRNIDSIFHNFNIFSKYGFKKKLCYKQDMTVMLNERRIQTTTQRFMSTQSERKRAPNHTYRSTPRWRSEWLTLNKQQIDMSFKRFNTLYYIYQLQWQSMYM